MEVTDMSLLQASCALSDCRWLKLLLTQHTRLQVERRLDIVQLFSQFPMDEAVHFTGQDASSQGHSLASLGGKDRMEELGGEGVNLLKG